MAFLSVQTAAGRLKGFLKGGVEQYLGIPYAAPPVGALRWMPPQPAASWRGERDALAFGASCAQWHAIGGFAKPSDQEDCLYLNVYVPHDIVNSREGRLPVMVWIPGGGFLAGSGDEYDPTYLVESGVVFVSFNYRVGILGFFSHPTINGEGHSRGNYGIMDQQMALRWVQENIAQFGGDPNNVTIFGESAGAVSVSMHLISPASKGLFAKAIMQSSFGLFSSPTLEQNEDRGVEFAAATGCDRLNVAGLRALPVERLLRANDRVADLPCGVFGGYFGRYVMGPMVDGDIIPKGVDEAFRADEIPPVPLLTGVTSDEMTFFVGLMELEAGYPIDAGNYELALFNNYGDASAELARRYPLRNYPSASNAFSAVMSDASFACPVRRSAAVAAANGHPVYAYEFGVADAPSYLPSISFPYRAYHTCELPFLFKGFHGASGPPVALTPEQEELSRAVVSYWASFAATGSPNRPGSGLVHWPAYDPAKDNYLLLQAPRPETVEGIGERHQCAFWDATGRKSNF